MKHQGIDRDRVALVRKILAQNTGEMPSTEGGGGKGGHSDRTGGLAFRHRIDPTDPDRGHMADVAQAATIRLDMLVRRITERATAGENVAADLRRLDHLLSDWEPLSQWQTENLQAQSGPGERGCRSCQPNERTGRWSPIHSNGMCKTCPRLAYRVAALYEYDDEVPPFQLVDVLHRYGKVTDRDIHRVMAGKKRRD